MINGKSIAVIVPAYRVRGQILAVLAGIGPEADAIFVVDDGCPDGSGRLVAEQAADPRVKVLYHDANRGVGAAVVTGMQAALEWGAECLVKIDGDGQHDPALLPVLASPVVTGTADFAKGNRFYSLDDLQDMPRLRLFGNAVLSFVTKLSSGYWSVFDPTNGYLALHAEVFRQLPSAKLDPGYFFESDLLFRLNTVRARIVEIPMRARYAGSPSSLRPLRVIPYFLRRHLGNTVKRIVYAYFLRNFSIASLYLITGLPLLLAGTGMGAWAWIYYHRINASAPVGTVVLPALLILVGVQLLIGFFSADIAAVPDQPIHPHLVALERARRKPAP